LKSLYQASILAELGEDGFPVGVKYLGIGNGHIDLIFEAAGLPVPELAEVVCGIEHGRRIQRPEASIDARRTSTAIGTASCEVMAAGTADFVVTREARIEKQTLAECSFPGIEIDLQRKWPDWLVGRHLRWFGRDDATPTCSRQQEDSEESHDLA
jgi:hypothetical protein